MITKFINYLHNLKSNFANLPLYVKIFLISSLIFGSYVRFVNLFNPGFLFDMVTTQYTWGKAGFEMGVFGFWRNYTGFFDYSFLSLILETIYYTISLLFGGSAQAFVTVVKLSNWLVDIAFVAYIYHLALKLNPQNLFKAFGLAAVGYILPSLWFVSGVWGQNDTLIALICAVALELMYNQEDHNYSFYKSNFFLSGVLLGLAFWTKQQAILVIPVILLYHAYGKKWSDLIVPKVLGVTTLVAIYAGIKFYELGGYTNALVLGVVVLAVGFLSQFIFLYKTGVWRDLRMQLFGFSLTSLLIVVPCIILNYERLGSTLFAVVGRSNVISNGGATFWSLIEMTGMASDPIFKPNILSVSTAAILIYFILIIMMTWSWQNLNISKLRSLNLKKIFNKKLSLQSMLIFMTISSVVYFLFLTKMHSRYLHFGVIFALLTLTSLKVDGNFWKWLWASVVLHLSYTLNQMAVFTVVIFGLVNKEPAWVDNFLLTQNFNYWKFSSLASFTAFIILYILSRQILSIEKPLSKEALDKI